MILIIDCFKLVKGEGKSIGIYNLTLNLVRNLVSESKITNNEKIKNCKIIILGNIYNSSDFSIDGVDFMAINYNPLSKVTCILWELFIVSFVCKKLKADKVIFPRGFCSLLHPVSDTIIVHDMIPFYYHKHYPGYLNKLENHYIMSRLKTSIRSCNQVITISEASKQDIVKIAKVQEEKIVVINNGCNKVNYTVKQSNSNRYIVSITSTLPHKNATGIIKSYVEYYRMAENPLPLTIIGVDDVKCYSLPVEVENLITCFKYIKEDSDLHKIIAKGTVFLFMSIVEGFGFPPIEAMQLGVPVICSNLSSLPEVVGDAAVLVNPTDYHAVGKAINDLVTDETLRRVMVKKGHQNASKFTWNSTAKLYWNALLK